MQGIYVGYRRPKSKKEIKDLVRDGRADQVKLEATSMFGNEYDGPITEAPDGTYTFVGPDPYKARNFYGNIVKSGEKLVVK